MGGALTQAAAAVVEETVGLPLQGDAAVRAAVAVEIQPALPAHGQQGQGAVGRPRLWPSAMALLAHRRNMAFRALSMPREWRFVAGDAGARLLSCRLTFFGEFSLQ